MSAPFPLDGPRLEPGREDLTHTPGAPVRAQGPCRFCLASQARCLDLTLADKDGAAGACCGRCDHDLRPKRGYVARGECHQSRSCYVMGCDNDICRAEQRRYVTRNRTTRMALGLFAHGPVGYDCGCRCDDCLPSRQRRYKREQLAELARLQAQRIAAGGTR